MSRSQISSIYESMQIFRYKLKFGTTIVDVILKNWLLERRFVNEERYQTGW